MSALVLLQVHIATIEPIPNDTNHMQLADNLNYSLEMIYHMRVERR